MMINGSKERPQIRSLQELEAEWSVIADRLLPLKAKEDSIWRFSRKMRAEEPSQGWKLHVSAGILNATDILKLCGEYLHDHDILFKACSSLETLNKLNSGIFYGFSQIGKYITVYPRSSAVALRVAEDLHQLTKEYHAPRVPYDLPYAPGSPIHYRYGGFRTIEVVEPDGQRATAIRDPAGKLWTDRREPGHAVPAWIANPFPVYPEDTDPASPLRKDFLVYEALSQRGKGGVYNAVDIRTIPARKSVLKEGRRYGEIMIDGRDGFDLIASEEEALRDLRKKGVPVPEVFIRFDLSDHAYLAQEFIEGSNLMGLCSHPRKKLPIATADILAVQVADMVARIHEAGWVWRDCKPLNILLTPEGEIRPVDFEGAVRVEEPSFVIWGTKGYTPPELKYGPVTGTNLPEDLFALGATLHQIYTSVVPVRQEEGKEAQPLKRHPVGTLRKGIDPGTRALIAALLSSDPKKRPTAREAAEKLRKRTKEERVKIDPKDYEYRPRLRKEEKKEAPSPAIEEIPGAERVVLHNPGQGPERVEAIAA